jgi:hypothetical protein
MRIALISWESLYSICVGGVGAHVTELAASLERKGHEVNGLKIYPNPESIAWGPRHTVYEFRMGEMDGKKRETCGRDSIYLGCGCG